MKIFDLFRMCLKNLVKRMVRTLMTVSGVVIGTCAIIVMLSLGIGLNQSFDEMIQEIADLTMINVWPSYTQNLATGEYEETPINDASVKEILEIPHVQAATPQMSYYGVIMIYTDSGYVYYDDITGVYLDQMEYFGYTLEEGRWLIGEDGKYAGYFGSESAYYFFDYELDEDERWENFWQIDADGNRLPPEINIYEEELYIAPIPIKKDSDEYWNRYDFETFFSNPAMQAEYAQLFTALGSFMTDDKNYETRYGVYLDIPVIRELVKQYNELNDENYSIEETYYSLRVRVDDMNNTREVTEALTAMGYDTYSAESMRQQFQGFTNILQMILGGLAMISLLVAAIGISNTMVMSITERTREIGVMKVLGCSLGNIRTLFLMEAGSIGFFGGILGVAASYGLSSLMNNILPEIMGGSSELGDVGMLLGSGNVSVIPLWLVGVGLVFATCVGLVSGFLPANRAVKISPLEAIRHD